MANRQLLELAEHVAADAPAAITEDRRVDGSATHLGRIEQWVLDSVRRYGVIGFVVGLTAVIVLVSVTLTVSSLVFVFDLPPERLAPATVLGLAVPALVAPPSLLVTVRLTSRLDAAGKLLTLAALVDPLTGVMNRRGFFQAVDHFVLSACDGAVGMVDVDEFKQLNDRYGHATGDLVLKQVADWLTTIAGEAGLVSRMGGDEFAFVIPSSEPLDLQDRQILRLGDTTFSVTIGTATYVAGEDFEDVLVHADENLYRLKDDLNGTTSRGPQTNVRRQPRSG